jgi:transcriptional regulator with XRE-family HTH domain
MTASATLEVPTQDQPQADQPKPEVTLEPGQRATSIDQMPGPLKAEIIADRKNGLTLIELKHKYDQQVAFEAIKELLEAAGIAVTTKREAAKKSPKPKAASPKPQPEAEPKPEAPKVDPKVAEDLATKVLDVRQRLGFSRAVLCDLTALTPSAIWRVEQGRVRPAEVDTLTPVLDKIARGEVAVPERKVAQAKQPAKAELIERIAQATALLTQAKTGKAGDRLPLINKALAVLAPPEASEEAAGE